MVENYATAIEDYAFDDNIYTLEYIPPSKAITGSITFQNVMNIGEYAFWYCSSLTSMTLPNVTHIKEYAFQYCEGLTNVTIPNVTSIGGQAFTYCRGLTNVTMPNVTSIGYNVFSNCSQLTIVMIGSSIQTIGGYAFATYANPITLTIGKTVAEVQAMGTTDYDYNINTICSEWGLPSGSTIVCTDGTITIE